MKTTVLIVIFTLFLSIPIFSQKIVNLDIQNNSYLAIKGSSNVVDFSLRQAGKHFLKRNVTLTASKNQNKIFISQNQLAISVQSFSSDNVFVLRDFRKMLKSDRYPHLQIQLVCIEMLSDAFQSAEVKGKAIVNITITGITKQYSIPIKTINKGELTLINGEKRINIHDFGLTPPTEMMGLIKVSEWILVDFQLNCKITLQDTSFDYAQR